MGRGVGDGERGGVGSGSAEKQEVEGGWGDRERVWLLETVGRG